MTIGKKLYVGFGSILGILVLLSLVSFTASQREHSARNTAAATLQSIQTIEKIRFQVMENGLDLRNYLLSGDPREESAEAAGVRPWQPYCERPRTRRMTIVCAKPIPPSNRINRAGKMTSPSR